MTSTCDQCGQRQRGATHETATGRKLCPSCWEQFMGMTAGAMAGGGIQGAASTAGWFSRVRRALGREG